jgi:hypothetical protein
VVLLCVVQQLTAHLSKNDIKEVHTYTVVVTAIVDVLTCV